MYRTCIFCSADLGANDVLETFPVGRTLAFDAWKGRLWAICPRCARWNLAPIEERWEAVEAAEARFRGARQRMQSENVGLAMLPDATRLVRIGEALPGEFAAWRYGDQLQKRRVRHFLGTIGDFVLRNPVLLAIPLGGVSAVASLGASTVATLGLLAGGGFAVTLPYRWHVNRRGKEVLLRMDPQEVPPGGPRVIRRVDTIGARLELDADGEVGVSLETEPLDEVRRSLRLQFGLRPIRAPVNVRGDAARRLLRRLLVVRTNRAGASRSQVAAALAWIDVAGSPDALLKQVAERRPGLGSAKEIKPKSAARPIQPLAGIAVELAVNEETEREALEGELRALREAWREADEIAGIADSLLDVPGQGAG